MSEAATPDPSNSPAGAGPAGSVPGAGEDAGAGSGAGAGVGSGVDAGIGAAGAGPDPGALIEITFKLYASLTQHLPLQHRTSNYMQLKVARDATIAHIIEPFALPMKLVHLVLINGHYIAPADRATRTLLHGDVLAIWPPVAGG